NLTAYAHQDVPFEYLVEILNPTRTLNHHPLFQIMLALQNAPDSTWDLPGLSISTELGRTGTAKFDLFFSLVEKRGPHGEPEGITGAIEYSSDLYDETTVHTLFERLTRILETATDHPDQPLSHIDALSPEERHRTITELNATDHPVPEESVAEVFTRQVTKTPDAPALVTDGQTLTYAELDIRTNRLAHRFIAEGIRPGDCVAVLLQR
ncbi:condensation domain-containing protein, partial [Streptomyces parvus]|uniref:condensation domain-containing protein n=1 Tax=Streptomyces parvus TaxID=66428 RepID=UPI001671CA98